ncbi:MAG: hypothetical protein ABIK49_03010 [candidate division WOR-3 bacterium]
MKNSELLRRFEEELIARTKPDYKENLRIAEALYQEAVRFGVWPPKDPLEGIETVIQIARFANSVRETP